MEKVSAPLYECHVNTNKGTDNFVGIRSDGDLIKVCFPLGYDLGKTDAEQKEDIRLLIRVLTRFSNTNKSPSPHPSTKNSENVNLPIHAYMSVLDEYYNRGYYTENERILAVNGNGAKNWSRTIKTQRAYPQGGSFVYLSTVARRSRVDSANLITKINEFCVEEAYNKIGFLFSKVRVKNSSIPFDKNRFVTALKEKLRCEQNDANKRLFSGMLDMIQYLGQKGQNANFFFGTNDFEYVWEKLVDFNFGESGKETYFPRGSWYLGSKGIHPKTPLRLDTIMLKDRKVFILDAKYYRYGSSDLPQDLPPSSSINKQITYGEYVATAPKFKTALGSTPSVFNAFLMPFNKNGKPFPSAENMLHIGEARGDWKNSGVPYERVQGILLDVKWMMQKRMKHNKSDICQLAQLVETVIAKGDPAKNANDHEGKTAIT